MSLTIRKIIDSFKAQVQITDTSLDSWILANLEFLLEQLSIYKKVRLSNTVYLEVNGSAIAELPHNYKSYIRIGELCGEYIKHLHEDEKRITTMKKDDCGQDKRLESICCKKEKSFTIDERNARILFSTDLAHKEVALEYIPTINLAEEDVFVSNAFFTPILQGLEWKYCEYKSYDNTSRFNPNMVLKKENDFWQSIRMIQSSQTAISTQDVLDAVYNQTWL